VISVNGLTVDLNSHRIFTSRDGEQFELRTTGKEFDLLCFLLSHPGEVLSRELILDGVWGHGQMLDIRIVDVFVYRLRHMMLGTASEGTIKTVPKLGYRVLTGATERPPADQRDVAR
jgi:DNA-binding response OmpR family regulator